MGGRGLYRWAGREIAEKGNVDRKNEPFQKYTDMSYDAGLGGGSIILSRK